MGELAEVIDATEERFKAIAPHWMKYDAEKGFAIQIFNNNAYLGSVAKSSPHSVQQALTNVASIGLSLNPAKRQAYLIARTVKTKDENGRDKYQSRIFLEPSYIGLCDIITGSGMIEWIQAQCVYANDKFKRQGINKEPLHEFDDFAPVEQRGEFKGVYCVAKTTSGDYLTDVMSAEKVLSIRNRSEAWKSKMEKEAKGQKGFGGPWETDFEEMAKKTVVRHAFKMLPKNKSLELAHEAVHMSNENEGFEPILTEPNLNQYTGEQKGYFDQMIEKQDSIGMYCFMASLVAGDVSGSGADIWTSLTHSFPKGNKGKYQKIVERLCQEGESRFNDLVDAFLQAYDEGNQTAIQELLGGLPNDAIDMLKTQLDAEHAALIAEIVK